jgi:hypothetical protein
MLSAIALMHAADRSRALACSAAPRAETRPVRRKRKVLRREI